MENPIINRILREVQNPELLETLTSRMTPTDLQSLLLAVYRERAKAQSPTGLMRQYEQNRFVQPAKVDPRTLIEFDRLAFSLLPPGFEPLELSPVCPLGTNSAVARVDQNVTVTTVRNSEVCSDSTNVLALECARRRRALNRDARSVETKLAASHRVLRAQVFAGPATFAHFRIFSLCTAGRDTGSYRFETQALGEHIEFYLRLLKESASVGLEFGTIKVELSAFDESRSEALRTEVIEKLAFRYPEIHFRFDPARESGRSYYVGTAFRISVSDMSGTEYQIVDGGFTNWTQQLLSNRKERLLISGAGTERLVFVFGC